MRADVYHAARADGGRAFNEIAGLKLPALVASFAVQRVNLFVNGPKINSAIRPDGGCGQNPVAGGEFPKLIAGGAVDCIQFVVVSAHVNRAIRSYRR